MRILIVEDDEAICKALKSFLNRKGFVVDVAHTGEEGYRFATEYTIDLSIIDVGLPGMSGIDLVKRLRSKAVKIPILVLAGMNTWEDKVAGLEAGADDYLTKPCHFDELGARIKALLRRAAGNAKPVLSHGNIKLDTMAQEVKVDGTKVELTAFEYKILEYLMLRKGEVISKKVLTAHVYAGDSERDCNVMDVFIAHIRYKIDPRGVSRPIETLRGHGYRIPESSIRTPTLRSF